MNSTPLPSSPNLDLPTISSSLCGTVTYWSSVTGYGFVRSNQVAGRMTIYRDSFLGGMVDEVSMERRMVRFNIEDSTTDVISNVELVPIRERTWSERVQDSDVGREEGKERGDADKPEHSNISQDPTFADTSSRGEGVSVLDLPSYVFKGVIVTFKKSEAFGFIRSCEVPGDVYVHTEHMDAEVKKGSDLVGKTVLFTVKDAGRKSLEARNMVLADVSVALSVIGGRIVAWDGGVGEGCVEVEQMGLRMMFVREELEVTRRKQTNALVGRKVRFHLQVDRNLMVEAKSIKLVSKPLSSLSLGPPVFLPPSSFKQDMLASLPTLDMAGLTTLFDDQLKTCLPAMTKDLELVKLVLAVIRRETQLAGQTTIQDKVARMISSKISSLVKSLTGCELLDKCLKMFSGQNKCLLAEQLEYSCQTTEQLLQLWQLGSSLFMSALPYMEEATLASIACTLSNQYIMLATNIKYVATLCSFFSRIRSTNLARQVLGEVEEQLVTLSYDKYGHQLVEVFLEHGQTDVQEQVVISLSSQVVELAYHPSGHSVIMKCIKASSDQHQLVLIENICKEDTAMVRLARDQYGYMVVLTMLEVSRNKQIHNTLRTAILVKQEEVAGTEFGREVIKTMRTKYRAR